MNTKYIFAALLLCAGGFLSAQRALAGDNIVTHKGKEIYIPNDLREMDLNDPSSKWSFSRMIETPNCVLFWAPGFGDNIADAPDLEGHNMKVDLANLMASIEKFYNFYYNDLKFVKKGTKADKYKMMVMLDYSLEGTAYGGDYDSTIGALWIAPNRVQDKSLNCIAHELGHSFQSQIMSDGEGEAWGGSGFFEMASQWMLWQVNPEWQRDERFHLDAFAGLTHKAYLSFENIYHSPYVLEMWSVKHGLPIIADLFRNGKRGEDPVMTYQRITSTGQEAFNDEMRHNYARLVNWDIDRVRATTRGYTDIWSTTLEDAGKGWKRVAASNCPEDYGFNVIRMDVPAEGKTLKVDFRGEAGRKGFVKGDASKAGWRYGFVAIDSEGKELYGEMKSDAKGSVSFSAPDGRKIEKLWMVVMGAPKEHEMHSERQWPYSIRMSEV